jgi:hypothetical protein
MEKNVCAESGRYVLCLKVHHIEDFLGRDFDERSLAAISEAVMKGIDPEDTWAEVFDMSVDNDCITFVQRSREYEDWVFTEARVLGAMVQTAMLARGMPVTGFLSFDDEPASMSEASSSKVQRAATGGADAGAINEPSLGIYVLPSAWKPYERQRAGTVALYAAYGNWRIERGEQLLLNPFLELEGAFEADCHGEIDGPYAQWCEPFFPNELLALKFVCDYVEAADKNEVSQGRLASGLRGAMEFYKDVLPVEVFEWARTATSSPKWGELRNGRGPRVHRLG